MIAQGLVSTAFQPIWDVQKPPGRLGFEALARPSPELGLSGPQRRLNVAQRHAATSRARTAVCTRKTLETAVNLPAGSVIFLELLSGLAHPRRLPTRRRSVGSGAGAGLVPSRSSSS